MARQTGILKFTGRLGGLSFYAHKHYGMLVRQANPVSAERVRTDPAFARTRESSSEFGSASRAAKLLRHGLRGFLQDVGTEHLDNRLMQHLLAIKNQDVHSARGARNVARALADTPALLGGFELHAQHALGYFLGQEPVVDAANGLISLRSFRVAHVPKGATHVALAAFRGRLDFDKGERDIHFSERLVVPVDLAVLPERDDPVLSVPAPALASGVEIIGMQVVFLQEVNGELLALRVGAARILESLAVVPHVEEMHNRTMIGISAESRDPILSDIWIAVDLAGDKVVFPAPTQSPVMAGSG